MTIRHHVSDELLFDYATGQLGEAWSLAVATHLTLCPICRAKEARFADLGGEALDDLAPVAMDEGALDATLALLRERLQPQVAPARMSASAVLPQPLRDYVGGDVDTIRWSPLGGGIRQYLLETRDSARARLLYIPPNDPVPAHGHRGLELTLVLAGSFTDSDLRFHRGDLEIASEDVEHLPIAGPGEPCICLAVTDAPLRFKNWLPRLAQPFTRI